MNWKPWLGINSFVPQARLSFPNCLMLSFVKVVSPISYLRDLLLFWLFQFFSGADKYTHCKSIFFCNFICVCSRGNMLRILTHQNKQNLKMLCDVQSLWRQLVPRSLLYTEEINTIILCIISPAKHCRLFLSTNGFFALAAERNFSCVGNRTCPL